jgi:hypothetical protein
MTTTFQKIIEQCDDIDLMDDATIFSISGTKSEALAQLLEIENILELINCFVTYIKDDSTGYYDEEFEAYSVTTNLPMLKFYELANPHRLVSIS